MWPVDTQGFIAPISNVSLFPQGRQATRDANVGALLFCL